MQERFRLTVGALLLALASTLGAQSAPLKVGDKAPDFNLPDQNGNKVSLNQFLGKKNVVLAFYVLAFTGGWTKELKAYQADIAKFEETGSQVLGVSVDSQFANKAYAEQIGVTFPLLSDFTREVTTKYGILNDKFPVAHRTTFVIDKEGMIQHIDRESEALDPNNAHAECSLLEHRKNPWRVTSDEWTKKAVTSDERTFFVLVTRKLALVSGLSIILMPLFATSATLKVGDRAPDFALPDQNGKLVKLADFRGKKSVILAFYIRASTPGWAKEIKAYQGDIARFKAAGAQVLGISLDTPDRNRKFAQETGATFPLLSDTEKQVAKAYGVLNFTRLFANRVTFVIDKGGIIRHIDEGSDATDPSGAYQACSLPRKQ